MCLQHDTWLTLARLVIYVELTKNIHYRDASSTLLTQGPLVLEPQP